jgi:secreted Zn-dependent insulinase-like peptidase
MIESRRRALARVAGGALLVGCLAGCVAAPSPIQSPNDDRDYAYETLDNGLRVLLVSDPAADKAASALTVDVGSFADPPGRGGLAHFLEHMLFLGTDKYPDPDEYQRFISANGGSHNAYTAGDHTNYFFDIQPDALEETLDRFARFFVAPRLDPAYVEREKNAVNSEYQLYLDDDGWRGLHVNKLAMNPAHPGAQFNVGSLATLAGDVQSDLLRFYEQHYSADRMTLVVLGPQPLGQLRAWVLPRFGAVPRRTTVAAPPLPSLYAPGSLPVEVRYRTVKDASQLVINFPLPALDAYYRQKPADYIANLLAHEGEGTLHAALKARGWIESLAGGADRFDAQNGLLVIAIELTDTGEAHVAEIEQAVYDYIALVRAEGIARWRYEEQARINQLEFRFEEKTSSTATVYRLAPEMRLYPPQDVLVAPYLMSKYDETLIRRFLDALTPENAVVEIANPRVDGTAREPWFQVPYDIVRPPPQRTVVAPVDGLALPAPNPFLPDSLALDGRFEERPSRVVHEGGLAVWLARDTSFGAPRANTYLELEIDGGIASADDAVYASLYADLVEDALNAYAYPALLAGLAYDVSAGGRGFGIAIAGFDDKQPLLLDAVLNEFATVDVDPAKFALYKDALARALDNVRTEPPYQQAMSTLTDLLTANEWPVEVLAPRVAAANPEGLAQWRRARLARVDVTALLHGNVDEEAARRVARVLRKDLALADVPDVEPPIRTPDGALRHDLDVESQDAALVLYVQGTETSLAERARYGLAAQILEAPFFNELRTEQQLGYAVQATPARMRRTPGIAFAVQSPVAGPDALFERTTTFLTEYRATLAAMPPDEFAGFKRSLAAQLREKDENLAARGARFWGDLDLRFLEFDSYTQVADAVMAIEAGEFLAFYDALLARVARERLVVYSGGKFDTAPPGVEIADVESWKRGVSPAGSRAGKAAAQPGASVRSAQ